MKRLIQILILAMVATTLVACSKAEKPAGGKVRVVATIFPVYDFARQIAGAHADVSLLLPPGVEPHHFEPRPDDIVRLNKADIFIFTNRYMEPWGDKLLKGAGNAAVTVVEAGKAAEYLSGDRHADGKEAHGHDEDGMDPHIWLDFGNAQKMVENIAAALIARDPAHAATYRSNADAFLKKLSDLDAQYRKELSGCRTKDFLHGGHYAFGYLARRYALTYRSAYPVSPDAEPGPRELASLVSYIRKNNVQYVFFEELVTPRVAEMLGRETGAKLMKLHGAHNVTKEELAGGATFLSLMGQNLVNLKKGLGCTTP